MRAVLAVLLVAFGCGTDRSTTASKPEPVPVTAAAKTARSAAPVEATTIMAGKPARAKPTPATTAAKAEAAKPTPAAPGHDFTSIGKALFVLGACGEGTSPELQAVPARLREKHCAAVSKAQQAYRERWITKARAFFRDAVPRTAPKKVVYPFAGGDLSTALTVYPDADEITTLSLEPAGDPRTLVTLAGARLERALGKVEDELEWLYRVNFSNTLNMIDAMRGGQLPTQLIFGLSALKLHGFELASVRYFRLEDSGAIHYLDDADVAAAPAPERANAGERNFIFANVEVQFAKHGGRTQVWRHIRANLGNRSSKGIGAGLDADPRVLRHLENKGPVSAMTKAASYLLSWESFSRMRDYLLEHALWMVSDATGVAPKWGKPAGFEYETYGVFEAPHIAAGNGISADWKQEFAAQPRRALAFRFGYYDKKLRNHLVIMRKKS